MPRRLVEFLIVVLAAAAVIRPIAANAEAFRSELFSSQQASAPALEAARASGVDSIALLLDCSCAATHDAAARILLSGLKLEYWIEVGRCPELADAHPEWMASLQGHREWRRHFPKLPEPREGETVKCYPWVPVSYEKSFAAHLARVRALLKGMPPPSRIYLNDLQAAPSACGCGNILCRWTADFGPIKTATPLGPDAAAGFIAEVKKIAGPETEVVPVWTPECQEDHGAPDGACAGVGCFEGDCWRAWSAQLGPIARGSHLVGALALDSAFGFDPARSAEPEGWIESALGAFQKMPPLRGGEAVPPARLVAVIQGWDAPEAQIERQRSRAEAFGAAGTLLAREAIDQSWEARMISIPGLEPDAKRAP